MTDLEQLEEAVTAILSKILPTQKNIREKIALIRTSFPGVSDIETEKLAIKLESIHGVRMSDGAVLQDHGFTPWLDSERSSIEPYYWQRYLKLMASKRLSSQVLGGLSNVTDRILGLLENPNKPGRWDRRGMVMGHVQSGKTANYIGVINKAADAGYRVIIVIAGLHNNLRNQTQKRIDEGFIGYSSTAPVKRSIPMRKSLGVSHFGSYRQPNAFTTSHKDFHKGIAESLNLSLRNLSEPAVFVIKKNTNTLKNLIDWLRIHNAQMGTNTIQEPMLLIDDEADNASINIKQRTDEISRINGQIRKLLRLFERCNYLGYTATPFANIFIDPDSDDQMWGHDLFPRNFIVSLDPPTNYLGPEQVFNSPNNNILHDINDHEDLLPTTHKIDHEVLELPESLKNAIRAFICARAIRLARGQVCKHNSMLVNASRFVSVQTQIRNEIQAFRDKLLSSVRVNGTLPIGDAVRDPELLQLYRVFKEEYDNHCKKSWPDVQQHLCDSISSISIVEINSRSADSLDYSQHETSGLNVIAVGGFSLSRGLTLEGLTVSYFLRRSMMYDTLFQMGRWFGYRDGYRDLCRVWMLEEAQGWYSHIAESIDELRSELVSMQSANATPRDFGLKVRSHPDSLVVTARNKMGAGKTQRVEIGLANHFIETAILYADQTTLEANLHAAVYLAKSVHAQEQAAKNENKRNGGLLVKKVSVEAIDTFLGIFKNHPGSPKTESDPVRRYIASRSNDELQWWDVFFAGVSQNSSCSLVTNCLGFELVCQRRASGKRSDKTMLVVTNKQRVSSRGVTKIGLTDKEVQKAQQDYDVKRTFPSKGRTNYPDYIYGRVRKRPLLIVHLLAIGKKDEDLSNKTPVVAWSISFPGTKYSEKKVEYVVNPTWYREHYGDDDTDEEDEDDPI